MNKFPQKSLENKVYKTITDKGLVKKGDRVIVAVSGGVDSRVLLDVLLKLKNRLGIEIVVCHFNHKMRGSESDSDERFVVSLAEQLGLDIVLGKHNDRQTLKSEEEAREARYSFFAEIFKTGRGDKLAIAHTADDVAETFLFRLVRGTGSSGLSSIPFQRENFIRPLLDSTRQEIEAYQTTEGLEYVTDSSNFDTLYTRNFLRLKVFPLLKQLNPSIITTLSNSARLFEEESLCIQSMVGENLKKVILETREGEIVLSREQLLLFPSPLQRALLRSAIQMISSLKDITQKQIEEVCNVIEKGEGNKYKILPHSLRVSLLSGKIVISIKEKNKNTL